jgi:hypothetical protein
MIYLYKFNKYYNKDKYNKFKNKKSKNYFNKYNFLKKENIDINNNNLSSKELFSIKVKNLLEKKKKITKIVKHFLFIKITLNNLFAYVYNFYNVKLKRNKYKILRSEDLDFCTVSLGLTKYKGPAKRSNISIERAGALLQQKLILKKINSINLVLNTRINRKIKEFLKGFFTQRIIYNKYIHKYKFKKHKMPPLVRIERIILFPKVAHNGPRLKNAKRL